MSPILHHELYFFSILKLFTFIDFFTLNYLQKVDKDCIFAVLLKERRDGRAVECGGLENR